MEKIIKLVEKVKKIISFVKSLPVRIWKDYNMSPKSIKILLPVLLVITSLIVGCSLISPSQSYAERQAENAQSLFPKVHKMIDATPDKEFAKIWGITEDLAKEGREAAHDRFNSWQNLINTEHRIIRKMKAGEDDGK